MVYIGCRCGSDPVLLWLKMSLRGRREKRPAVLRQQEQENHQPSAPPAFTGEKTTTETWHGLSSVWGPGCPWVTSAASDENAPCRFLSPVTKRGLTEEPGHSSLESPQPSVAPSWRQPCSPSCLVSAPPVPLHPKAIGKVPNTDLEFPLWRSGNKSD